LVLHDADVFPETTFVRSFMTGALVATAVRRVWGGERADLPAADDSY
jgi:hypothetical protein